MSLEVGFGSAVITPSLPVVLAGFGARKGEVSEVRDDLEAQAVVLSSDGTTLCLLVLDLLMLGPDFAAPMRAAVGAALGVTPSHVLTSCTHTHSGPAATASVKRAGWPVPPGYLELLVSGCVEAARRAQAALEPARLAYARDRLPAELSLNRRGLPYDPAFAALDVLRPDGARIGTIANVGIHPVALGVTCRAVSTDWVGRFRTTAAAQTGAPVVLLQGALGDVNPVRDPHTDPDPAGNWDTADELGRDVAEAVVSLLGGAEPLPATAAVVAERRVAARAGLTIPSLLSRTVGRTLEAELVEWSLGGVRLVSLPGEAFHALGRAVEEARGDRALLAGLSPVWLGYLPVPFGRGYEEKMSYGKGFVAAVAAALTQAP